MRYCANVLHRSLRTVAPRVAFYKHKKAGQQLPHCGIFARSDAEYCRWAGLELAAFLAFQPVWAASSKGVELCRHEQPR